MRIENIPTGKNAPWDINVIIEIASGGPSVKYEFDKDSGALWVDRVLDTAMYYPCDYGFVPHTLAEDGDAVDALVVAHVPVVPGCVYRARPIGVLEMEDEAGQDQKVICVPVNKMSPYYCNIENAADLPAILLEQIKHFFSHYKDLEPNKWVKVGDFSDAERGAEVIRRGIDAYNKTKM